MKPYSKDLRLRVLTAVDRGMPRTEAARVFDVSASSIRRYLRLRRDPGDVDPKPVPGPPASKGAALEMALPAQVKANPLDITLSEHCDLFEEAEGIRVSTATMSHALKKLGLPLKNPNRLFCGPERSLSRIQAGRDEFPMNREHPKVS